MQKWPERQTFLMLVNRTNQDQRFVPFHILCAFDLAKLQIQAALPRLFFSLGYNVPLPFPSSSLLTLIRWLGNTNKTSVRYLIFSHPCLWRLTRVKVGPSSEAKLKHMLENNLKGEFLPPILSEKHLMWSCFCLFHKNWFFFYMQKY